MTALSNCLLYTSNNALRVRTTLLKKLPQDAHALTENVAHSAKVTIAEGSETAEIVNGKIKATVNGVGIICFYKDNELILQEYYSYYYGSIRKEADVYKRQDICKRSGLRLRGIRVYRRGQGQGKNRSSS